MDAVSIQNRINEIEEIIAALPQGNVVYKNIKGKKQPYLQWYEDGKVKSKYIKVDGREEVLKLVEKRTELTQELKELKSDLSSKMNVRYTFPVNLNSGALWAMESPYRTRVVVDSELERTIQGVEAFEKRDCYRDLENYIFGKRKGKVCLIYGLRRTGKTTLLFQAIQSLSEEERLHAAYIKARTSDNIANLNYDLRLLAEQGYKYVFIDEVTLIDDFIDSAALFSDVFAMQGMKIVLSGTDSLGFWFTLSHELYDRAYVLHTTFIPFQEYNRLLGINDIDEYIKYGGTLKMGETDFDDEDVFAEDAPFRDDETTRRYIDTAICSNIQHSLKCCERGNYFRHLRELYEEHELTGAINRIIESMNHQFLLSVLTEKFKSHDLGSAAEVLRKQRNPERRSDILDQINKEKITKDLMRMLEIRNMEYQKIGITATHVEEIKEYLRALDLIIECPSETTVPGAKPTEYILFTQPGMRYAQAQALVHVLMNDEQFSAFDERERLLARNVILEEVRGRMMEDIVLLETANSIRHARGYRGGAGEGDRAFKLTLKRSEVDMVIYSPSTHSCRLFEIKHSKEIVPNQYHVLEDIDACEEISKKYGDITEKTVIYRGPDQQLGNGIHYRNVERYLCEISLFKSPRFSV